MTSVIGIDLGTTFSAVARVDETGRPVIVHNTSGQNITPSVVQVDGTAVDVGEGPARKLGLEPNVYGRFKRDMGSDKTYEGGQTPTSLSAFLLKHLKSETGGIVTADSEVVVTIPANFANEAREATLAAARKAGLNVKHIINEPTAAALYFAKSSGEEMNGRYAVFDLGGGTFDVTVMEVRGQDINVLSSEGVSKLGGDDFDRKIQEIVSQKYLEQSGVALTEEDFSIGEAEELKKTLSRKEEDTLRLRGDGGRQTITVTRSEFEEGISSLVAQMEMLCEMALDEANIDPEDIQKVILAGGSTRMPVVQQIVRNVFRQDPVSFGNPDEVVALGASVYAAFKTDKSKLNSVQRREVEQIKLSEITTKFFGTLAVTFNESRNEEELQNAIIIEKGASIPHSVTESFFTRFDGQTSVNCKVTEANSPESDPKFVKLIWEGSLELPSGRPKGQEIAVTFSYNENQQMECSFVDVATGKRTLIDLTMHTSGDAEELDIEEFVVD